MFEDEMIELDDGEYRFLSEKFDDISADEVNEIPKYIIQSRKSNFRRLVNIAIKNELDETMRKYVTDKYFGGLTVTEIAKKHSVSRQAVYRALDRAQGKLFGALKYAYCCGFSLLEPPESLEEMIKNTVTEGKNENNYN